MKYLNIILPPGVNRLLTSTTGLKNKGLLAFLWCLPMLAHASPDYSIYFDGTTIVLSDQMGTSDVVNITEVPGGIQFDVPGRNYAINAGATLPFPVTMSLAGITNLTIHSGEGDDVINLGGFAAALPLFSLSGGKGNDQVNITGNINFQTDELLDIDLVNDDPNPGMDAINIASQLILSGDGKATLRASAGVTISGKLSAENGDIIVEGNVQTLSTPGNFRGVQLLGGHIESRGDAYITVRGRGGNAAAPSQYGVFLDQGRITGGPIHEVYIQGSGGNGTAVDNIGFLMNTNSVVESSGAPVTILGEGNGTGISNGSRGVFIFQSLVQVGGSGDLFIEGKGANSTGSNLSGVTFNNSQTTTANGNLTVKGQGGSNNAGGNNLFGINFMGNNTMTANGAGSISLTGTAGLSASGNSLTGIAVQSNTLLSTTGSGSVTLLGTGRGSTSQGNMGIDFSGAISTASGDISMTGHAGGTGTSGLNYGLFLRTGGGFTPVTIQAGGGGHVYLTGNGAYDATGNQNRGISMSGATTAVTTSDGDITLTGKGGGAGTSGSNIGILMTDGAQVKSGGSGKVWMDGTGGKGSGTFHIGISVENGAQVGSDGGDVTLHGRGTGTGTASDAYGIQVLSATATPAVVSAGQGGKVNLKGTGGVTTGNNHFGIVIANNGRAGSLDGDIDMSGTGGGSGPANAGYGIYMLGNGTVQATGDGALRIIGTGGKGVGGRNIGVLLSGTSVLGSAAGPITITGVEGNNASLSNGLVLESSASVLSAANIELIANSMLIGATATIGNGSDDIVTLRPLNNGTPINLGGAIDPLGGPLYLTDAELDRISTGTLVIGNAQSGGITVSQPLSRPSATDMILMSAGSILVSVSSVNTAGGDLLFQAAQGVFPAAAGVDVEVGSVSFSAGTALNIQVNGVLPDAGYTRLNVVGTVNLTGAKLSLSGNFIQPQCTPLIIVLNDGTDAVIGQFTGLPQGALIVNYLGSGKNVSISYTGGDGNDVVLIERVLPKITCPANIVKTNDFGECGRTMDQIGSPAIVENCGFSLGTDSPVFFGIGETTVTWTITDDNGNQASCAQKVTINDTEYPTFECPTDMVLLNQEDFDCGAQAFFQLQPSDNCPGFFVEQSHLSGEVFDMGITYFEASVTDASGNVSTCAFKVTVDPRPEICNGLDDDCDGYTDELQDWELQDNWYASDPAAGNRLGESVDLKGNWGIAGSQFNNANTDQIGTAYLLNRDANTGEWLQATQLFPDNFSAGNQFFGAKVAMGNGYAAVSAPLDDEGGANAGAVYVFRFNGANAADWVLHQKILGTAANEQLGSSLDFSAEGLLLIGASLNNDNAPTAGAAYLFGQTPVGAGNWNLIKKLVANDSDAGDQFGFDVAVSGAYALVSANSDDEKGANAGAAYVFSRNLGGADNWGQLKKIVAADGEAEDNFGVSVDLDGAWAVVGANKDDDKGPESGSAYMYHKNQGGVPDAWNIHVKMRDFNGAKGEHYGYAVSIDGDHIAVGARWKRVFQSRAGAVFVYHREDSGWAEFARLTEPDNRFNDHLGSSVAIDGQFLLAGIPGEDLSGLTDCGAVLVFEGVCGDDQVRPGKVSMERSGIFAGLEARCFPVPFAQVVDIQVEMPKEEALQVRVFDVMGREVALLFDALAAGTTMLHWDAGQLPTGNYFIRISTADETIVRNVVRAKP